MLLMYSIGPGAACLHVHRRQFPALRSARPLTRRGCLMFWMETLLPRTLYVTPYCLARDGNRFKSVSRNGYAKQVRAAMGSNSSKRLHGDRHLITPEFLLVVYGRVKVEGNPWNKTRK